MTDGSAINGEIVSYANGVYIINSPTFGKMNVMAEKVLKIEFVNYVLPNTPIKPIAQTNNSVQSQVSTYGQTLMKNPKNAAIFTGLASDPGLQEKASNPQLLDAAKRGDIQALLKNPEFMDIVNSPEVQEAVKKIKQ